MSHRTDYYELDRLLNTEELQIRDSVRHFAEQEYLPIVNHHFERGTFPAALIPKLGAMGLLGANLPEEYGCAGLNNVAYGLALQELEWADSGLRSFCSVQGSLVMYPIHRYGSEEQRRYWLPRLAAGEAVGCFGLTEPDHGSDPGGMETRARQTDRGYVLNGAKMWITSGSMADVAVVWAKLDGKVAGFLVEKGTPGFSAREVKGKYSLRASDTSELILEDCEIPAANRLPEANGLGAPLSCLNQARFGIAWGAVGAAMACYEAALRYAGERTQFSKPIAAFQLTQHKLVEMLTEITKAQLLAWRLGHLKDEGRLRPEQVSLAKRNNVAMALHIAREARGVLGANGICDEYHVIRHMLNLESVHTYEGTFEIHTLIVGRDITGHAAFGG